MRKRRRVAKPTMAATTMFDMELTEKKRRELRTLRNCDETTREREGRGGDEK